MAEGVRYRFLSVVGEGGFGRVYRARIETDEGFNKDVAIKVLSDSSPPPSLLKRFRDEARILGLLRDRAIVSADPPILLAGRWSVSMEFVDGASLGAMILRRPVPPGVAVEIVSEIARALHHAFHQEGLEGQPLQLLHRDIKPENIQITPSGEVKILDFGIARANFKDREFKTRHALGGTPGYIAPERTQGIELPVGDVYSLGVVLHEAVTGIRPRYAPTVVIQNGTIDAPSEDLEVHPSHLEDPDLMEVIRLAAWMRADEADQRPQPREVEDWCRRLRQKLPPPYLREWAEEEVPHRTDLPPDDLIGQVVTGGNVGVLTPSGSNTTPITDVRTTNDTGLGSGTPVSLPPSMVTPGAERSRMAMGAVLGGGVTLIAVLAIVMVVLVLTVALFAIVDANRTPPAAPAPRPSPSATARRRG
ncbi:MAG: serine/threonine-protein kinase [Myxococcota bacterium]